MFESCGPDETLNVYAGPPPVDVCFCSAVDIKADPVIRKDSLYPYDRYPHLYRLEIVPKSDEEKLADLKRLEEEAEREEALALVRAEEEREEQEKMARMRASEFCFNFIF